MTLALHGGRLDISIMRNPIKKKSVEKSASEISVNTNCVVRTDEASATTLGVGD